MLSLSRFLPFFLLVTVYFVNLVDSHSKLSRNSTKHVAIFVFGDSLYDPGNNYFLPLPPHLNCNRYPYGETFFNFPTGRCSDGRIIPDFISIKAKLPLWRPYLAPDIHQCLNGANFASAGAGVLLGTNPGTLYLELQVKCLEKVAYHLKQELGQEEANKLLTEAIYMLSIGGVDYEYLSTNSTESQQEEYLKFVIGNLTNGIMEIYKTGGRKFALQNIGPMGCIPRAKQRNGLAANECLEELNKVATLHNEALLEVAEELENKLDGFKYSIFDYYNMLYNIIENPSKYGLVVPDVACCGIGVYRANDCGVGDYELCNNPREYVFFDGEHPTEAVYKQMAELFWNGKPPITKPLNLKRLVDYNSSVSSPIEKEKQFWYLVRDE